MMMSPCDNKKKEEKIMWHGEDKGVLMMQRFKGFTGARLEIC